MIVLFNRKRTRWRPLQLHYLRFWSRPIEPSDPPSHRLRIIIISITVWPRGIGGIKTENSCKSESSYRKIRNAKEAEVEWFCDDLQDLLELIPKERCPFHHRGLECKSRKLRDTWSNRQIWPWSTEWNRAKANRVLQTEPTGHSKHPLPTIQETTLHMDITRWLITKSDWLCSLQPKMEKVYTVSKKKTGSWLWLRLWILIAKFRLKWKKVGKTTKSTRYGLNWILYDYTVEVTKRFKGWDLIDRVLEELWMEVRYIVQEPSYQTLKIVPCWCWLVNSCCSSFPSLPSPLVTTLLYQCKGSPLAHWRGHV